MTKEFLKFTKNRGNDLITPRPEYDFPGLKPNDNWCICAGRYTEAVNANKAPPLIMGATNEVALEWPAVEKAILIKRA